MWTPHDLRDAISAQIAALEVRAAYQQISGDAWTASDEPFSPDQPIPIAGPTPHLLYHVDVREIEPLASNGTTLLCRAVFACYALTAIPPLSTGTTGTSGRVTAHNQALAAARHLWYTMAEMDSRISGITTHPVTDLGSRYAVTPLTEEQHLIGAWMPITYHDSLEA